MIWKNRWETAQSETGWGKTQCCIAFYLCSSAWPPPSLSSHPTVAPILAVANTPCPFVLLFCSVSRCDLQSPNCALGPLPLGVMGLIPIGAFWGALWNGHRILPPGTEKVNIYVLALLPLGPELSHAVNSLVLPGMGMPQTGWLGSYWHLVEEEA